MEGRKRLRVCLAAMVLGFCVYGLLSSREEFQKKEEKKPPLVLRDYHNTRYILTNVKLNNGNGYRSHTLTVASEMEEGMLTDQWYAVGPKKLESNLTVAVVCGQHAREVISSEICFHLVMLLYKVKTHPVLTPLIDSLHSKGVRFWVLPVVNVWGRQKIEEDRNKACLRVNAFEVDLNRNFRCPDLELGTEEKGEESWPGPQPFSELETVATDHFLQMAEPEVLLNIHSGIERVLLPYDCCPLNQPPFYSQIVRLVQRTKSVVAEYTKKKEFIHVNPRGWDVGQGSHLLYTAHGSLLDYAMTMRSVQIAMTLEVFSQHGLSIKEELLEEQILDPEQCARKFNPVPGKEYAEVVEAWLLFILRFAEIVDNNFVTQ